MIAVGNGEVCPFCKHQNEEDRFVVDGDYLLHLIDKHPQEIDTYLFGDSNIGV